MGDFIEVKADYRSISSRGLVYGLGVNDVDYYTQVEVSGIKMVCPAYLKWKSIMGCLSKDNKYSVCDDWVYLTRFKSWLDKQDHKGKQINTVLSGITPFLFSPENCVFIDRVTSNLLNKREGDRGQLPIGVTASGKSFKATISMGGKRLYIGLFSSADIASKAYNDKKHVIIVDYANNQDCEKIKNGLLRWAEKYKCGSIV
jgi:hypothetical protein